LIWFKMLVGLI